MSLPRGLWRTTPVRFAAALTALFCLVLGVGLGAVYLGTVAVVDRQTDATLDAEIRALSERFEEGGLGRLVEAIDGVEVHGGDDTRLIVTIEGTSTGQLGDKLTEINLMEGVLAANMVFEHAEEPEETTCHST